jgi:hypothetical protein
MWSGQPGITAEVSYIDNFGGTITATVTGLVGEALTI